MKSLTIFILLFITAIIILTCKAELYAQIKFKISTAQTNVPGLSNVNINDINDSDAVAGISNSGAFIYDSGKVTNVPILQGWKASDVQSGIYLNNKDEIGGTYGSPPYTTQGFIYENGKVTQLGKLNSAVNGINDQGTVCGYALINQVSKGMLTYLCDEALIYQNGAIKGLGVIGGDTSYAMAINNNNWVAGNSTISSSNNFFHGFVYKDGFMTDLGALPKDPASGVFAINDSGYVVGYSSNFTGYSAVVWDYSGFIHPLPTLNGTTKSYAYRINDNNLIIGYCTLSSGTVPVIWINGKVYNINDLLTYNSVYTITFLYSINNRNEILAQAYSSVDTSYHQVILKPIFGASIIRPASSELVVANKHYQIQWQNLSYSSLEIDFSSDGGNTFSKIASGIPGSANSYSWLTPEIVESNCRIRLVDESNPANFVESDRFKVKGYVLTKFGPYPDLKYILYNPIRDGWQFPNDSIDIWPIQWFSQFNYITGTDPYTHKFYDPYFLSKYVNATSSDFPDWPLVVEAFGTNQCYLNVNKGIYRRSAIDWWAANKKKWHGSCLGFAVSSILAFEDKDALVNEFPEIGSFDTLSQLPINDYRRKLINLLYIRQFGIENVIDLYARAKESPAQALQDVKDMIMNEIRDDKILIMNDQNPKKHISYCHAVTPYEVDSLSTPGLYKLYMYDNNFPFDDYPNIEMSMLNNSWYYNRDNVDGHKGLYLGNSATDYLNKPTLVPSGLDPAVPVTSSGNNITEIFATQGANISVTDSTGNKIGFTDDSVINEINGGIPIIPISGKDDPPIGYIIPNHSYTINMNSFPGSISSLNIFSKDIIFGAFRNDAQAGEEDNYNLNNGFSVTSYDNMNKNYSLKMIIPADTDEKEIDIENLKVGKNDSLKLNRTNTDGIKFINYSGSTKTYDLKLWYGSVSEQARFNHDSVKIAANTTDEIIPDWFSLDTEKVLIKIDSGNDGSINDSIYVVNQNNALPVELTSFTASVNDQSVKLKWNTATETNNYGFEIERQMTNDLVTNDNGSHSSLVNGHWVSIGFVKGAGNSTSPKHYSFVDKCPGGNGKYEYRLKQIDYNGTFRYSKTIEVSLSVPIKFALMQNYPNPFNPSTTISYSLPKSANVKIEVFNVLGEKVATLVNGFKQQGNYKVQWNAEGFASGLYFYKLTTDNFSQVKKMILLK